MLYEKVIEKSYSLSPLEQDAFGEHANQMIEDTILPDDDVNETVPEKFRQAIERALLYDLDGLTQAEQTDLFKLEFGERFGPKLLKIIKDYRANEQVLTDGCVPLTPILEAQRQTMEQKEQSLKEQVLKKLELIEQEVKSLKEIVNQNL